MLRKTTRNERVALMRSRIGKYPCGLLHHRLYKINKMYNKKWHLLHLIPSIGHFDTGYKVSMHMEYTLPSLWPTIDNKSKITIPWQAF